MMQMTLPVAPYKLDVSNLPAGVYVIEAETGGYSEWGKFLKE